MLKLLVVFAVATVSPGSAETRRQESHVRLLTARGPVHLWTPRDYDPSTAATVVYVHGYFANVDRAWKHHQLADQFRASGLNALFVACEAPTSMRDRVSWPSLSSLLDVIAARTIIPKGRLVVMGHSGAHRTISGWLAEPRVDTVVLVDAAYGDLTPFATWLDERDDRRLIDVGDITRDATDAFHARIESAIVERFPPPEAGALPESRRDARVVYVRSWMGHMELVKGGVAIPMLLRALSAPLVPGSDRSQPLPQI